MPQPPPSISYQTDFCYSSLFHYGQVSGITKFADFQQILIFFPFSFIPRQWRLPKRYPPHPTHPIEKALFRWQMFTWNTSQLYIRKILLNTTIELREFNSGNAPGEQLALLVIELSLFGVVTFWQCNQSLVSFSFLWNWSVSAGKDIQS